MINRWTTWANLPNDEQIVCIYPIGEYRIGDIISSQKMKEEIYPSHYCCFAPINLAKDEFRVTVVDGQGAFFVKGDNGWYGIDIAESFTLPVNQLTWSLDTRIYDDYLKGICRPEQLGVSFNYDLMAEGMEPEEEEEKVFETGARRGTEADSVRNELAPFLAINKICAVLTHGAKRYGDFNWTNGLPLSSYLRHIERHLGRYKSMLLYGADGFDDLCTECTEDPVYAELLHLGCNLLMVIETIELIKMGKLPESLLDFNREESE